MDKQMVDEQLAELRRQMKQHAAQGAHFTRMQKSLERLRSDITGEPSSEPKKKAKAAKKKTARPRTGRRIEDLVMDAFKNGRSVMSSKDIQAALKDVKQTSLDAQLAKMEKAGKIVRLRPGVYRLPDSEVAARHFPEEGKIEQETAAVY